MMGIQKWLIGVGCMLAVATLHAQLTPFLNLDVRVELTAADKINTKHLEFSPAYYGDGIVFVHAREQEKFIDKKLGQPFFELMFAELEPDGMPGRAVNFSPTIRTKFHEGPACFTADEKRIYFTRSNANNGQEVKGAHEKATIKIYSAVKGAEDWEQVEELWFCSDDFAVMHPALSPDGNRMIFASKMPGGLGGSDLYITYRAFDEWSEPVNLGSVINTSENEAFPFWHENGVLFFASAGHSGNGGLDIFATLYDDQSWRVPVNLGAPFNSSKDDISCIVDAQGTHGFFASARKAGKGKDDIYAFSSSESIFNNLGIPTRRANIDFALRQTGSGSPVAGAHIWAFPMGENGPIGVNEAFDTELGRDDHGNLQITLKPMLDAVGASPHAVANADGNATILSAHNRDMLIVVRANEFEETDIIIPAADLIGSRHLIEMTSTLDQSLPGDPDKPANCLIVSGEVFARTSNLPIAEATISVTDTCSDVRRFLKTDDDGKFSICVPPDCAYILDIDTDGFLPEKVTVTPGHANPTIYLIESELEQREEKLEVGDVLVLNHIYYDFNKSAIRTGDARELASLANMMKKYPSMEIELQSHTDSRGQADYNLELSERRGIAAMEYLVARGVAQRRIKLRPMGETALKNGCSDGVPCTEPDHQMNRRTEIEILKIDGNLKVRQPGG